MRSPLCLLSLLLAVCSLSAREWRWTLAALEPLWLTGAEARVDLIGFGGDASGPEHPLPELLPAVLHAPDRQWGLSLRRVDGPLSEAGRTRNTYAVDLPEGAEGRLILEVELPSGAGASTAFSARRGPSSAAAGAPDSRGTSRPSLHTLGMQETEADSFQRNFVDRFGLHEPIYFVYGNEEHEAKFQISFKYRLMSLGGQRADTASPGSVQLAYTQRSLWDIGDSSSPFYDTSYMPSLFYEYISPRTRMGTDWFHWLGLQSGLEHESNGQAGSNSRSLNTSFIRTAVAIGEMDGLHLLVVPELFTYVGGLGDNQDLDDYRGYGELKLVLGYADGPAIAYTGRLGEGGDRHTMELDLTIPVRIAFVGFGTYFHVQYHDGYTESLLDYRKRSSTLRFGISLVR